MGDHERSQNRPLRVLASGSHRDMPMRGISSRKNYFVVRLASWLHTSMAAVPASSYENKPSPVKFLRLMETYVACKRWNPFDKFK